MLGCEPFEFIRLFSSVDELIDPCSLFGSEVLVPSHEGIYYLCFFFICLFVEVLERFSHLLRVFCERLEHLLIVFFERFCHLY